MIGRPEATAGEDTVRFFEGLFDIPIYGQGEQIFVEIKSDKPVPCKFSTCEWIALVTGRPQPLQ